MITFGPMLSISCGKNDESKIFLVQEKKKWNVKKKCKLLLIIINKMLLHGFIFTSLS